jgi:hypothetical protein
MQNAKCGVWRTDLELWILDFGFWIGNRTRRIAAVILLLALPPAAGAVEIEWKKHVIDRGTCEVCCVTDVNNDGILDIVSGDNWYMGPNWVRRPCRELNWEGEYLNDCGDWPFDVNGDGYVDIITAGFFNAGLAWAENPQIDAKDPKKRANQYKRWTTRSFSPPHFVEMVLMVDIDGDGKPDVLSDDNEPVRWIEISKDTSGQPAFITHVLGKQGNGHGIGWGDVNGDGRLDVLTPDGWYEGPADPRKAPWPWHGEWKLASPNDPMLMLDVNGDGLNDVIYGAGHDYGLFWLEQGKPGPDGKRTWTQHVIDKSWSQVHPLTLADLSGDGVPDLITGKRFRAHNDGDPGGGDPPPLGKGDPRGVYWYETDRKNAGFIKHVIEYDGTAGGGLNIVAIDIDKDGDLDLVCPGKSGLYLFENLGFKK